MKTKFVFLFFLSLLSFGAGARTPDEILKRSDEVRGSSSGFRVNIRIESFKNDAVENKMEIITHLKSIGKDGSVTSLVKFVAPAVSRGQVMLRESNVLWLYSPNSRFIIRIPSQQRLMGNLSNGDVCSVSYRSDYAVVSMDESNPDFYLLTLKRKNPEATYPAIKYWVSRLTFQPQKAEFYTESGRLLKTMEFIGYRMEMGALRPYLVVTFDGTNRADRTVSYYTGYAQEILDEKYFRKNNMAYVP
jgi:hypothetical protein